MKVQRKILKAIGRYKPGDTIEMEHTDAAAFDLLKVTEPFAEQVATIALEAEPSHEPIRSKRTYRRRDMRATG